MRLRTSNFPTDNNRFKSHTGKTFTCVPLMMTVCAGKLTPHAKVPVDTKTLIIPQLFLSTISG